MLNNCSSLKSVINEGYFYFSGDRIFNGCEQLSTLQTKGFQDFYSDDSLEYAFYNCRSLNGDYYISFGSNYELYDYAGNLSNPDIEDYIGYSFTGCSSNATFHIGFQELVDYWNQRKLLDESKSDANFTYWPEGDHFRKDSHVTPPGYNDPEAFHHKSADYYGQYTARFNSFNKNEKKYLHSETDEIQKGNKKDQWQDNGKSNR